MSGSLNQVTLIGNVGAVPEIRSTQDGRKIANLRLATSENWRDKQTGERREKTEWHSVAVFSEGLVKVIEQYVHKGSKLALQGQLQTRKWQDRDGNDRYSTEVVLQGLKSTLVMLDGKQEGAVERSPATVANSIMTGGQPQRQDNPEAQPSFAREGMDDCVPFDKEWR